MPRKVISKTRKNDMDMRAPVEASLPTESVYNAPEENNPTQYTPRGPSRGSFAPKIFLCILVILALAAAFYFYREWSALRKDPQSVNEEKTLEMVSKVSRLIDLPRGETPVLATVTDTSALEGQPFFTNAESGHIVLYYAVARKAYLYDLKNDTIVEVATLGDGSQI